MKDDDYRGPVPAHVKEDGERRAFVDKWLRREVILKKLLRSLRARDVFLVVLGSALTLLFSCHQPPQAISISLISDKPLDNEK